MVNPEHINNSIILENQKIISPYAKSIEALVKMPLSKKLLEEAEKIRQNKLKIQNSYDINNPRKYRQMEDVSKYHPLALEYYGAQEQLRPYYEKKFCQLTTNIQSLANKTEMLSILGKANVNGFEEKLENLFNGDNVQYEKTLYELKVAAQFVSTGHLVSFIEPSTNKSADLLIDNSVGRM